MNPFSKLNIRFKLVGLLFIVAVISLAPTMTQAAPGNLVATLVTPEPCYPEDWFPPGTELFPPTGTAVAFDGTYMYYGCFEDVSVHTMGMPSPELFGDPYTPIDVPGGYGSAYTGFLSGVGPMAWDRTRRMLWVGAYTNHGEVYLIDPHTGQMALQFVSPAGAFRGLAYDATDDTLWLSSWSTIFHLSVDGALIDSFDNGEGVLALAVGGPVVYFSDRSSISALDKATGAILSRWDTEVSIIQELECDDVTFAGKNVLWARDFLSDFIYAYEVPAGTCSMGGASNNLLNVPDLKQDSPAWAGEPYGWMLDNGQRISRFNATIGGAGSYITSVANIMRYHGITTATNAQDVNPQTLNDYLSGLAVNHGYAQNGIAIWAGIQTYSGGRIAVNALLPSAGQTKAQAIDAQLALGHPVMVSVPFPDAAYPNSHWVVITGPPVNGHYPIRDPGGHHASDLAPYGDEAGIGNMMLLLPTNGYEAQQRIAAHGPVELLITDTYGRRTGYDPDTQSFVNEIPQSRYATEYSLLNQENGFSIGLTERVIYITRPSTGNYTLTVTGTGSGSYTLDFQSISIWLQFWTQSFDGVASSGLTTTYRYRYDTYIAVEHGDNHPPTLTVEQPIVTVNEGNTAFNRGTYNDPDGDPLVFHPYGVTNDLNGGWTWSQIISDSYSASVTVTIEAVDPQNARGQASFELVAHNVAPTATFSTTIETVALGRSAVFVFANPFDPSPPDTSAGFRYSYDCEGDGQFEQTDSSSTSVECTFNTPGTIPVTGRISDKDGGFTDYVVNITVEPVTDQLVLTVSQNIVTVNEGDTALNGGTVTNESGESVLLTALPIGTATNNDDGTWSWNFATDDGPAQNQTVVITADDPDPGVTQLSFPLVVNNVAPTAVFESTYRTVGRRGVTTLRFSNPFDPSSVDTDAGFLYSYDCEGDGQFVRSPLPTSECEYLTYGVFTAKGRIEDKDGGFTEYQVEITVLQYMLDYERLDRFTGFQDSSTIVTEGATIGDRFRIRLAAQPAADVTVWINTSDPQDISLVGPGFRPGNWFSATFHWDDNDSTNSILGWHDWYTISLTGNTDTLAEGPETARIQFSFVSADPNFDGYLGIPEVGALPEQVTVYDAGVVVSPLADVVDEGSTSDYYSVVLSGPPGLSLPSNTPENVTVTLGGYDSTLIRVEPATLTFTRNNWRDPQYVRVEALDDNVAHATPYTTTITHTVSSDITVLDSQYGGPGPNVTADPVVVTINDNDLATTDIEVFAGGWIDDLNAQAGLAAQATTATLQVNVRNNGPAPATNVTIAINTLIDGQVTFVSANGPGSYDPAADTWIIPSLPPAPDEGATVTLELTVSMLSGGTYSAAPALSYLDVPDLNSSNNTFTATLNVAATEPAMTATVEPLPTLVPPTPMPQPLPVIQTMDDGAPQWSATGSWQLTPGAAFGGTGLGWQAVESTGTNILSWTVPLDLSSAQFPRLRFQSLLIGTAGMGTVEVSSDGVNWQMITPVQPSDVWTTTEVPLTAYAGTIVTLRFVWAAQSASGSGSAQWQIDQVEVENVPPQPPTETPTLPAATATETPTPTLTVTPTTPATPTIEPSPTPTSPPTTAPTLPAEPSVTPTSLPTDLPPTVVPPTEPPMEPPTAVPVPTTESTPQVGSSAAG